MGVNMGHWFSFENKTSGRAKKCFKEVTSTLKGWKKKFFLIDRQAVSDAMPWRHTDIDLHDDFPTHYNENDAAPLAEVIVPLRPPLRHLLYVCGLTTVCRHSNRAYHIKDQDMNGKAIPDKSPFQKNLEKPNSKIVAAREKKDQQNLAKAQTKYVEKGGPEAPRKKKRLTIVPNDVARAAANIKKEVVDLSANSFHFAHHEDTEEGTIDRQLVPNLGLRDDLRLCTFRACKELISHQATSAEESFLGNLTNVKVVSRTYQSLGSAHNGLLKELSLLDVDHSMCPHMVRELLDRVKDLEKERDDLRQTASDQVERIKVLKKALKLKLVQMATAEGKVKVLEDEKAALMAKLDQAEEDSHKLVREFIPTVVKKLHTSVEYRQSLAAPVSLCFTAGWLGGLSLGRIDDQIVTMLLETQDLDIEGSKLWEAKHHELFTMQYPYV
uniref:Transposase (Putative), gypsy type n=1 Tax=Tanacetum cinerariifolium TaxID=118510 RepID=A0A6L2J4H9_TANCI|nr:hypothetical protein [Tanacetum cinerariifolium]